ncbi:hypothetical protein SKAU_G00184500 [Synaphobranchus kaupii]|uniref:Uncharacterized protein n=1 Tax=Synaphobranchus kaupii TaxID=118154 RepID=A0A9Q1FCG6_SYNKA|nr:hypothetical protein SKAU_G00184500 [Synaphobranchus kaupii]
MWGRPVLLGHCRPCRGFWGCSVRETHTRYGVPGAVVQAELPLSPPQEQKLRDDKKPRSSFPSQISAGSFVNRTRQEFYESDA